MTPSMKRVMEQFHRVFKPGEAETNKLKPNERTTDDEEKQKQG